MLIVIDCSKKLSGFNLFESFLSPIRKDGKLSFINYQTISNNDNIDYDKLKNDIQNILYEQHANYFNLCILFDMDKQKENPLTHSITSNVHNINDKIINPISKEYKFDKLYYLLLDDIQRNNDYQSYDKNINMSINFDSKGYIDNIYDNIYSKLTFNKIEIEKIDEIWTNFINKHCCTTTNLKKKINEEFIDDLKLFFEPKINLINKNYPSLLWYSEKLDKIYTNLIINFEKNVHKFNHLQKPSETLKELLKNDISSYSDDNSIIIHIDLNDNNYSYNSEVSNYRHQLEIISLIIYLAANDTRFIFEDKNTINRQNHWKITSIINNNILSKILSSYNLKLKIELSKIGKFANNEIVYNEFAPRTFNYSSNIVKPDTISIPIYSLLPNNKGIKQIQLFNEKLYNRYITSIDYANRRLLDFTIKLRIQKEAKATGTKKKTTFSEMNSEILKTQEEIKLLQEKVALYQPKMTINENPQIKCNYDTMTNEILVLMAKRIHIYTFIKNLFLIIFISTSASGFFLLIMLDDIIRKTFILLTFILPLGTYIILQIKNYITITNKVNNAIYKLAKYGEDTVNKLFLDDNKTLEYVQNIYNLIMLKKHYNECNLKVIEYNKNYEQYMYHYNKLKEHIEMCDKLFDILGVSSSNDFYKIENIKSLDIQKGLEENSLYSPLCYLLEDEINNRIIVNNQKNIELNSRTLGFIEEFIITYDKEYDYD